MARSILMGVFQAMARSLSLGGYITLACSSFEGNSGALARFAILVV
jgi:hypothetical protein